MKILLLAGEQSGELYAARIRDRLRGHEIRGYGDAGFAVADLAVMGFWPVLRRIFFFLRVKRTMERLIDSWRPDVVCTVDYPGMNLKLAAYARRRGIRAVHVVCPQVWAWKKGRIPRIEASLDRLCCFFPFEPRYFRPGFAVFVGHPLAEEVSREAASAPSAAPRTVRTVALLPGSRIGEIERNLPAMLETMRAFPGVRAVIPAANDRAYGVLVAAVGATDGVEIRRGGTRELLRAADCAVVASGTATLEAALVRCPTVLVYRVSAALAWFARRVIREIRHIGLANIIAEKAGAEPPMPELLQEEFTADRVAGVLRGWLEDEAARREAIARLDRTMALLESGADPVGRIVAEVLGTGPAAGGGAR